MLRALNFPYNQDRLFYINFKKKTSYCYLFE